MQKDHPFSIVIVTNQLKNIKSGVGTVANVLINELKNNYNLLIICPESEEIQVDAKNITIQVVKPNKLDPTNHKWFSFGKQATNITNKLDPVEYKVVMFLDAREGYYANKNIVTLGMIHDFYSDRFSKLTWENIVAYPDWIKRIPYFKVMKQLENRAYNNLDWLITDSDYAKKEILKRFNPNLKITVLRNGIDFSRLKHQNKPKEKNTVLFVGGNFYRKGLVELLQAIEIVAQTQPVKCYVIGKDKISRKLKRLSSHAIFLGQLDYDETSKYYNSCQVFCMPSHFENYAMVYLEALYYNMQVIASKNSGTVEIKKYFDNLYIVDPKNIIQIAETIKQAMANLVKTDKKNLSIISSRQMGTQCTKLINQIINY